MQVNGISARDGLDLEHGIASDLRCGHGPGIKQCDPERISERQMKQMKQTGQSDPFFDGNAGGRIHGPTLCSTTIAQQLS